MKNKILIIIYLFVFLSCKENINTNIKDELTKPFPNNKTINFVFHGHSVPCGYTKTPIVNTFDSYPFQFLQMLKEKYPYAVVNVINTGVGGENSVNGSKRFKQAISHSPSVIFIDYALNDLSIELKEARRSWQKMIDLAKNNNIKVVLLTPSADSRINLNDNNNKLKQHAKQIIEIAKENRVEVVDVYKIFEERKDSLSLYLSSVNHPNRQGNELIALEILKLYE